MMIPLSTIAKTKIHPSPRFMEILGLFESNNNDRAVGKSGEVSRYQMLPAVVRIEGNFAFHPDNLGYHPTAQMVAQRILTARFTKFYDKNHKRVPNTVECYILWNAPAQIKKPSKTVLARAKRFEALYNKQ